MATDYDKLYQETRHVLGEPTQAFVDFFTALTTKANVLDLGCGQGRDALMIARLGHHVTGVDLSRAGIQQLEADAKAENLGITGVVADLVSYEPTEPYDVILIDRTLHMLSEKDRLKVLKTVSPYVKPNGFILIADEPRNLPAMKTFFTTNTNTWATLKHTRGFLFLQHADGQIL